MKVALHGGYRNGAIFTPPTNTPPEDIEAIEAFDGETWHRYEPDGKRLGLYHFNFVSQV